MRSGEGVEGVLVHLWEPKLGASLTHMQRQAEPRNTEAAAECARRSFTKDGFADTSDIEGENKTSVTRVLHLMGFLGASLGDLWPSFADFGGTWGRPGRHWGRLGWPLGRLGWPLGWLGWPLVRLWAALSATFWEPCGRLGRPVG